MPSETHNNDFSKLELMIKGLNQKSNQIIQSVNKVDGKVDALDNKVDKVVAKVVRHDNEIYHLNKKYDSIVSSAKWWVVTLITLIGIVVGSYLSLNQANHEKGNFPSEKGYIQR